MASSSTSTSLNPTNSDTTAPALNGHDGGQHGQHHQYDDDDDNHWSMMKTTMRHERAVLRIPPGWRFCPTDQELINFYLKNKILKRPLPQNTRIVHVDIYKYSPMQLAEKCQLPGESEMFFFTPRGKKYPRGSRPNRTAGNGYWKLTGQDKEVVQNDRRIGYKSALVFFIGKQNIKGQKTSWLMKEYTLTKNHKTTKSATILTHNNNMLDEWVLCKVYENTKKKNKKSKQDIDDEEVSDDDETNSSTPKTQAQDGDRQVLPNYITTSVGSAVSYLGGQYNMINGSTTHLGSSNNFGTTHQDVTNSASSSYAKQESPNTQGGHGIFSGISAPYGQSVAMYNNGSHLDNNGHDMFPIYPLENRHYHSDEPLPEFGYLDGLGDHDIPFGGMPIDQYVVPLDSINAEYNHWRE